MTDELQFNGEANLPPSIESTELAGTLDPATSLGQVVKVPVDALGITGVTEVVFPVVVRDPNVDQTLLYRAFLDCPNIMIELARERLAPQGTAGTQTAIARELELRVAVTTLSAYAGQCCKLELLVSSEFDFVNERDPVTPGDIGSAAWWLAITDTANPEVEMTECP